MTIRKGLADNPCAACDKTHIPRLTCENLSLVPRDTLDEVACRLSEMVLGTVAGGLAHLISGVQHLARRYRRLHYARRDRGGDGYPHAGLSQPCYGPAQADCRAGRAWPLQGQSGGCG